MVGLPETFVVAGDGTIEFRYAGPITREIMENRIRPAMERRRRADRHAPCLPSTASTATVRSARFTPACVMVR